MIIVERDARNDLFNGDVVRMRDQVPAAGVCPVKQTRST